MEQMLNFSKGKIIVTDPCYAMNTWCTKTLNVKKGKYTYNVDNNDCGVWGNRNKNLIIKHCDNPSVIYDEYIGRIAVDSGQAGFFDYEYYKKYHKKDYMDEDEEDNAWYHRVCDITCNDSIGNYGSIDNMGCVSESGYGDGMYEVYAGRDENDEIVEVMIVFISDEEEEDWDDEDEWEED